MSAELWAKIANNLLPGDFASLKTFATETVTVRSCISTRAVHSHLVIKVIVNYFVLVFQYTDSMLAEFPCAAVVNEPWFQLSEELQCVQSPRSEHIPAG